jgi:uncharacterized membrane-anchored protein
VGDFLSQPRDEGGLGLGAAGTTALFLAVIIGVVVFFTVSARHNRHAVAAGNAR